MRSYQMFLMIGIVRGVKRDDGATIPFDMANMDCRQFIADWRDGATVLDQDDAPAAYSEEALTALGLEPIPAEEG